MTRATRQAPPQPLTPITFHVLLALSTGSLHGYGVMRRVEETSGAQVGPGAVYGSLHRLQAAGWVMDAGVDESDPRRGGRYALTPGGREALHTEALRLESLTELARKHRVLSEGGR
jgi:DNA-binding PadR family transcriptional regulator